jgi:heme-degrading monooxygenase HmoA
VILEHAWLPVTPGREDEFEASMRRALPVIESAPECFGAEVRRQLEDPSVYLLTVRWATYEAHMAFRASDLFVTWRELTHPYYREPAVVTHFDEPLTR